jgi:ATP-binding cassette, subfamily C, bacterial
LVSALIAFVGLTVLATPVPVLITMLLIFARLSGPAMQMSNAIQQFANMLPAYEEVRRLDSELMAQQTPERLSVPVRMVPGPVVFRNVSFHYQETRQAAGPIVKLDLVIQPGSFVGVSGPSGVGKTTFADLLVGLLEPDRGEMIIGDTPLRGASAVSWRDHVSYVAQDPYLFRDTIRRNLLWAAARSQCHAVAGDGRSVAAVVDGAPGLRSTTPLQETGCFLAAGRAHR